MRTTLRLIQQVRAVHSYELWDKFGTLSRRGYLAPVHAQELLNVYICLDISNSITARCLSTECSSGVAVVTCLYKVISLVTSDGYIMDDLPDESSLPQ